MMRKAFLLCIISVFNISTIYCQEKVFIPDTNFKDFLNTYYPSVMDSSDDSLIISEAANITGTFDCRSRDITNISGIEYFTGISTLHCHNNDITSLPDLSDLTLLTDLNCSTNELTSIPQLPLSLEDLGFTDNPVTVFPDLSTNVALQRIYCFRTEITNIPDLSANVALEGLYCYENSQLTSLPDLSANTALTTLRCGYCALTSLPALPSSIVHLHCYGNDITHLPDLSACTNLSVLRCYMNNINTLPDFSTNIALTELHCSSNGIQTLPDFSLNTNLIELSCSSNDISSIPDLSNNTLLEELSCGMNNLIELPDLSANINLKKLYCTYNQIEKLPVLLNNTKLEELGCSSNLLDSIPDLSSKINLTYLNISENKITTLVDLSLTQLEKLYCDNNQLTNLPQLPTSLVYLICDNNLLESLPDLSNFNNLYSVNINDNKLDFSDAQEILIIDTLPNLYYYSYYWQLPFGNKDSINVNIGETIELSISKQDSALSYQWFRDYDTIVGAVDTLLVLQNINCDMSGSYTCKSYGTALSSSNMIHGSGRSYFVSEPIKVVVNECATNTENHLLSPFKIYPNPTTGLIYIQSEQVLTYEIFNIQGILLEKGSKNQLNLSKYADGYYFIKIMDKNGAYSIQKILLAQ